jgi:hypothetical protein
MKRTLLFSLACLAVALYLAGTASCDPLSETGKKLIESHGNAVVTVRLVIKEGMSLGGYGSHEYESQSEALGTVIDPSGLVVLSLTDTDPSGLFADLFSDSEDIGFEMKSKISEVQILLADGTEIPARVVLRDKDLDLAFARPLEPLEEPMPHLDLSEAAPMEILQEAIILSRMGKIANRTERLTATRIEAIATKPRKFYVIADALDLGCPVFGVESGKLVGLTFYRRLAGGGGMNLSSLMTADTDDLGITPIVLPAADVLEVAGQAPQVEEVESEEEEETALDNPEDASGEAAVEGDSQ